LAIPDTDAASAGTGAGSIGSKRAAHSSNAKNCRNVRWCFFILVSSCFAVLKGRRFTTQCAPQDTAVLIHIAFYPASFLKTEKPSHFFFTLPPADGEKGTFLTFRRFFRY
jgi:hypothetical protein